MVWLIALRRQNSFPSHAVTGRGDHSDIGPWVCDGLIQTHIAMKQHCMGGSWYALLTGYGGLEALANKIKILVSLIWTPQHFTYFGWTFAVEFFSGVYHPQNTRSTRCKMLGCSNQRYENFDFICRCFTFKFYGWHMLILRFIQFNVESVCGVNHSLTLHEPRADFEHSRLEIWRPFLFIQSKVKNLNRTCLCKIPFHAHTCNWDKHIQ